MRYLLNGISPRTYPYNVPAFAGVWGNGYVKASGAIGIGQNCRMDTGASQSVGIGDSIYMNHNRATAIGPFASAYFGATAVGYASGAKADEALAFGPYSNSLGERSLVFGGSALCRATYSMVFGFHSEIPSGYTNSILMGRDAELTASNRFMVGTIAGAYDMDMQIGKGIGQWGATPPTSQPPHIDDPSGGTTVDAEARSAINAILAVLEGNGSVASV